VLVRAVQRDVDAVFYPSLSEALDERAAPLFSLWPLLQKRAAWSGARWMSAASSAAQLDALGLIDDEGRTARVVLVQHGVGSAGARVLLPGAAVHNARAWRLGRERVDESVSIAAPGAVQLTLPPLSVTVLELDLEDALSPAAPEPARVLEPELSATGGAEASIVEGEGEPAGCSPGEVALRSRRGPVKLHVQRLAQGVGRVSWELRVPGGEGLPVAGRVLSLAVRGPVADLDVRVLSDDGELTPAQPVARFVLLESKWASWQVARIPLAVAAIRGVVLSLPIEAVPVGGELDLFVDGVALVR
jgi:hypothetical protein